MSESQHDSFRGWVDASEVPFTELGVVRYTIGHHWLEIDCNPDGSYLVDSDLLDEEIGFRDADALLTWVEEQGLVEVLSHEELSDCPATRLGYELAFPWLKEDDDDKAERS